MCLRLAFRFHTFPELPKVLGTDTHEKFNSQYYCETKMSQTSVLVKPRN